MSNETESLSAILASARSSLADDSWIDEITEPDEDGQPNDYARRVVPLDNVLAELDRIAAAARRERAEWRRMLRNEMQNASARRAPGSAAALREALWDILDVVNGVHHEEFTPRSVADSIKKIVLDADAEPARNCDRFATAEDAGRAYRYETERDRQNPDCYWPCIFNWIFAPAREGGEHA